MADKQIWDHIFTNRPAEDKMPVRWDIKRTPPKGLGNLIVLSHDVVGADVHFYNGRTLPCIQDDCPVCEKNEQARWRGYLAVTNQQRSIECLVEVTAAAMPPIKKFFDEHRTLRGSTLGLWRKGDLPNGRLYAEIHPGKINKDSLPKPPSLKKCLSRIWQLREIDKRLTIVSPDYREPPKREADFGDEEVA